MIPLFQHAGGNNNDSPVDIGMCYDVYWDWVLYIFLKTLLLESTLLIIIHFSRLNTNHQIITFLSLFHNRVSVQKSSLESPEYLIIS